MRKVKEFIRGKKIPKEEGDTLQQSNTPRVHAPSLCKTSKIGPKNGNLPTLGKKTLEKRIKPLDHIWPDIKSKY